MKNKKINEKLRENGKRNYIYLQEYQKEHGIWNKGLTKETDERVRKYALNLRESRKGMKLSFEHRKNISKSIKGRTPWNVGLKTPESTKGKIRQKLLGPKNPFFGHRHNQLTKEKISESRKRKCTGKDNPNYIGFDIELFKDNIISKYKSGYSANYICIQYKISSRTILKYLKRWGIKPRKGGDGFGGELECKDGHKVRSFYELMIDNFLGGNGISHKVGGFIIDGGRYKYDFYIPELNLYIEYWGLTRYEVYNKRRKFKERLYKDLKLWVLSIEPTDNIFDKLRFLIPLCAKNQRSLKIY